MKSRRIITVIAAILTLAVCLVFAGCGQQADHVSDAAREERTEEDVAGSIRCLFVGNSVTYYNNMPEMYQHIVEAKTGQPVDVTTLVYSGRKTVEHAKAIDIVLRTKGNSSLLTEEDKALFVNYKGDGSYVEQVYQDYVDALLDASGKAKGYDYIFIQDHGREQRYEDSKEGAFGITESLADENTGIVLCMPNYKMSGMTLSEAKETQDGYDRVIDQVKTAMEKSDLTYREVKVAYEGRAFLNYTFYYGKSHAKDLAPEEYQVYKEKKAESESGNCLLVSNDLHPSQLGSYLQAATIYAAVYEESAQDTVSAYKATVTASVDVIGKEHPGQNYAIINGAFDREDLLKEAWLIADQTENQGLNLDAKSDTLQAVGQAVE